MKTSNISIHKFRIALAALGLVLAGVSSTRAAWAATCRGVSCIGQDPGDTGCNSDAYTVACNAIVDRYNTQIGRIALRYSPTCNAAWGRLAIYVPHDSSRAEVRNASNTLLSGRDGDNVTTAVLTPMTFGAQLQFALGSIFIGGTGFGAGTSLVYPPSVAQISCP